MFHEKNTFLINLKSRPDRLLFSKIKMFRMGYNIDNINIIEAVDAKQNINEFTKILNYIKNNKPSTKGFHPMITLGPIGLLFTYLKILEIAIRKDLDFVIMMEDDNYFHHEYIQKIKNIPSLLKENDVIYIGSNMVNYSDSHLEAIKKKQDFILGNNPIAGTFYIAFSKNFYMKLYHYLKNKIYTNFYPIDVLINLITLKNKNKCLVMYPRPVIPEVRDTDNTINRNHIIFYNRRRIDDYYEYDMFNNYDLFNKIWKYIDLYDYIKLYNETLSNSLRITKHKLKDLNYKTSLKLIENGDCSFNIIVKNNLKEIYNIIKSSKFRFWRITSFSDNKLSDERIQNKNIIDDDEIVIIVEENKYINKVDVDILDNINKIYKKDKHMMSYNYNNLMTVKGEYYKVMY